MQDAIVYMAALPVPVEVGTDSWAEFRHHERASPGPHGFAGRTQGCDRLSEIRPEPQSRRGLPLGLRLLRPASLRQLRYEAAPPRDDRWGCSRPADWTLGIPNWSYAHPALQPSDGTRSCRE